MNKLQASMYGAAAIVLGMQQAYAQGWWIDFWADRVDSGLQGSSNTADVAVQNLVENFMLFLGIIAVIYALYGGFKILTAGGNEDGVKSGKQILIQAGIGLVVIFLANSVVQFVLRNLFTSGV